MKDCRICIFTGSRAEYGILSALIAALKAEGSFDVRLLISGTHVVQKFGCTHAVVKITHKDDSCVGVARYFGEGVIRYTKILEQWHPQLLIVLGDRYETLAAATSATFARIPIAHIHGGEATYGAMDEAMRHAITKMSYLHFTSTEQYRSRVIQLGESPERVFNVGALGVDNARRIVPLSREEFQKKIGIGLNKHNVLVTFHPVTLEPGTAQSYCRNLLKVLDGLKETNLIFTMANADMEGKAINRLIGKFVKHNPLKSVLFASMGTELYMTAMHYVDAVIGNSSSGIIEAPSFKIGTINIGSRQDGRIQAQSVINCHPKVEDIRKALKKLYSPAFQQRLRTVTNPYGNGNAAARITSILKRWSPPPTLNKTFHELKVK